MLSLMSIMGKLFTLVDSRLDKYGNPHMWLCNHVGKLIDLRLSLDNKPRDYMQILLEAQSEELEKSEKKMTLDVSYNLKFASFGLRLDFLTLQEIKVNLVMFMLAGYDTTSNTLSYCSYVLATHPEEQAKLQDEIDEKFGEGSNVIQAPWRPLFPVHDADLWSLLQVEPDFENINDLPYLDMFIKEVLRMYPVANK